MPQTPVGEDLRVFPKRKSIRLAEYDYSKAGLYFVTLCVHAGEYPRVVPKIRFGEITPVGEDLCVFPKMILNNAGQMINKWWNELNNKYRNIQLHEYIIMPNHFHGIIQIIDSITNTDTNNKTEKSGEHAGSPLQEMIQWLKTMTTNEYIRMVRQNGWQPFHEKLWQRNYYEHIIRNERSYVKIAEYIINNPVNWQNDKYHDGN